MPFSQIGITEATPHDPAQANVWAATVNTNMTIIDNAIAGILPVTVTTADVILTAVNGMPDQSRNAHFIVTGALTGNRNIFFPAGRTQMMSVANNTTGAFSLTIAVNNGSGSPAGTTIAISQGATLFLYSDGTNIGYKVAYAAIPAISAAGGSTFGGSGIGGVVSAFQAANTTAPIYYSNSPGPNDHSWQHFVGQFTSAGDAVIIYGNGDIINQNNSYGGISDRKLKHDIVRAESQTENIKALSKIVSKYHLNSNPDGPLQIGLVHDEAEAICPGIVRYTDDFEMVDGKRKALGTQTAHIIYSIIPLQLLKATGEMIERIEALEATVAALKGG